MGVSEVPDGPRHRYLPLTLIWHVMLDLTRPRSKEIWPHGEVILQKNGCSTDPQKTAWAEGEGKRMISANWSFNVQMHSKMNRVWKYLVNRLHLHVCVQQNCGIFKYGLFVCAFTTTFLQLIFSWGILVCFLCTAEHVFLAFYIIISLLFDCPIRHLLYVISEVPGYDRLSSGKLVLVWWINCQSVLVLGP